MSSVREQVAAQIKADNSTYIVKPELVGVPDNLIGVQVAVFRTELTHTANTLTHECRIELMIGKTDEGLLDEVLDNVLLSLQRIQGLTWSSASRTVFDDKYHGYQITLTANSSNIYREIVSSEGATSNG